MRGPCGRLSSFGRPIYRGALWIARPGNPSGGAIVGLHAMRLWSGMRFPGSDARAIAWPLADARPGSCG
jgi:hypothetical protein